MPEDLPDLVKDLLYAEQHLLLEDEVGRAMRDLVRFLPDDTFARDMIRDCVRDHKIEQAFVGPYPLPKTGGGEIHLGDDLRKRPIRFPLQFLNAHGLTVAGSGSGKTIKARHLIATVSQACTGLWLFDFRKREFSMMQAILRRQGCLVIVIRGRDLRWNPLQVPRHVNPRSWAAQIAEILVAVLLLPPRATKLLHSHILKLYESMGIFEGANSFPTLFDLYEAVKADQDANRQARDALIDSLEPVLRSLGPVLNCRRGWTTADLAKHQIVFEFAELTEVDKNLLVNTLLLSEFCSRLALGISNQKMTLWICCDEAARLVTAASSLPGLADLIGLVRGTGIGLDLSVQSGDIAPAILSNTALKCIGRCGSAADYDLIGSALGLTRDQRQWMFHHLEPGLFVCQLGEGSWRYPFVVRVPKPEPLPAEPVNYDLGPLAHLTVEPVATASIEITVTSVAPARPRLSEVEQRYLRAVMDQPGLPSSRYAKLAGISGKRAGEIRHRLVELGCLREHALATGSRGRNAIVLEPLAEAGAFLEEV